MARYRSCDEPSTDEFADALSWRCRIIRDDNQVALALAHEFIDDAFGVPTPMKPPIIRLRRPVSW